MNKRNLLYEEVYLGKEKIFYKFFLKYFNESTNAVYLIRKMMFSKNKIRKRLLRRKLLIRFGIYVNNEAKIGSGLVLSHPHGIFITNSIIGKNLTIYQHVTIGRGQKGDFDSVPIIGDNVIIYAGATVIGKIKVGNNVIIGTNSVVNKDIPDNVTVAGNPARIIKYNCPEIK